MPKVSAGIGVERDDGAQKEIVTRAGTANVGAPGAAISHREIDAVEFGIVGDAVPNGAAAAPMPPLAGPALAGHRHGRVLEAFLRVARNGIEAPQLPAGFGLVGRHVTARAEVCTAVTDNHFAIEHARRTRDRLASLRIIEGLDTPDELAGLGIKRDQSAIDNAHIDLATPIGDATVCAHDDAQLLGGVVSEVGIEFPQLPAALRVDSKSLAVRAGEIQHP